MRGRVSRGKIDFWEIRWHGLCKIAVLSILVFEVHLSHSQVAHLSNPAS